MRQRWFLRGNHHLGGSLYDAHLEKWLDLGWPLQQFLIIKFEDPSRIMAWKMRGHLDFVGLQAHNLSSTTPSNRRSTVPYEVLPDAYDDMVDIVKDDVASLEKRLGRSFGWADIWKTQRSQCKRDGVCRVDLILGRRRRRGRRGRGGSRGRVLGVGTLFCITHRVALPARIACQGRRASPPTRDSRALAIEPAPAGHGVASLFLRGGPRRWGLRAERPQDADDAQCATKHEERGQGRWQICWACGPPPLPQRAHAHESGRRRRGVGGAGPRGGAGD